MRFYRFVSLLALSSSLLAGQGCAGASQPGAATPAPDPSARFTAIDANRDGQVVIEEFSTAFPGMNRQAFTIIDSNGDGAIDRAEWVQFMQTHPGATPPYDGDPNARMDNIPGDPLIPPPDSADLPLVVPPQGM